MDIQSTLWHQLYQAGFVSYWDCTLYGECTLVCPMGIDSKADILHLRAKSMQARKLDPTPEFQDDFGFNPNFG